MHLAHSPNTSNRRRFLRLSPWTAGGTLLLAAALLQLAARKFTGFAQWYAITVYPLIVGTLGRLTGLFPFSVVEIGLYALILFCLFCLIRNFRRPAKLLSGAFLIASTLAFVFTVNCGINYYRKPFSAGSGLTIRKSSTEELYSLCSYLVDQVCAAKDDLDALSPYEGQTTATPGPTLSGLNRYGTSGRKAMEQLGELFPDLDGFYPRPKALLVSRILSVQQLCGIYSPFTVEANYNREMPRYNIPHTICHELSHLKGFMREDEANFIGYMACIGSDDPEFRYSGYLTGWVYAGNALAKADMDAYITLHQKLPPEAVADLAYNNAYWNHFDGKVAEASTRMNDTYLKLQNQTDGVKSYGRMVDLMLAYYAESLAGTAP